MMRSPSSLNFLWSANSSTGMKRRHRHDDDVEGDRLSLENGAKPTGYGIRRNSRSAKNNPKKFVLLKLVLAVLVALWIFFLRFQYLVLSRNQTGSNQKPMGAHGETRNATGYDSIFCRPSSNTRRKPDSGKPVFLWGIPSTTSDFEINRRKLLRSTYLGFDKSLQKRPSLRLTNSTKNINANRICSFHDWTCNEDIRADCQMIYIFFVAGHKTDNQAVPPILVNESLTDFRDMLLPYKTQSQLDLLEPGTVYLDIRENQFDGKMTTWFKFASLVAKEYNPFLETRPIDYVFKVDSDLLLLTPNFFDWFDGVHTTQKESSGEVHRVYGGVEFPGTNCAVNFTFDHPCPLPLSGPSYMSGELNFCSVDLATYITSDDCPRKVWTIPHEDVSLSNYVYSYSNNAAYHRKIGALGDQSIRIVSVNTSRVLLLPNMRANWFPVSLKKNPEVLTDGELLWGHSIKRGEHKMYLYWKKDPKFLAFWRRFFKIYTGTADTTKNSTSTRVGLKRAVVRQNNDKKGANKKAATSKQESKDKLSKGQAANTKKRPAKKKEGNTKKRPAKKKDGNTKKRPAKKKDGTG